jgi:hypothetical protein
MTRRTAAAASTALAALAALATVAACSSDNSTDGAAGSTTTQSSDPTMTPPADEPIPLDRIPDDTPLDPGTYEVPFLAVDSPARALVKVPVGYVSAFDGTVVASGNGDIAFWGKVTEVHADPCLGGKSVAAGESVDDLVTVLAAQQHMEVTEPEPVTVGGYDGVHLTLTAPTDLGQCRDGIVTIYSAGGSWLAWDVPGATFDEWILDVNGQRVVGGARIAPDAANRAELISMVESAQFSGVDAS